MLNCSCDLWHFGHFVAVVLSGFKIGKCKRVAVVKLDGLTDGSCKEHSWISVCTPGLYSWCVV